MNKFQNANFLFHAVTSIFKEKFFWVNKIYNLNTENILIVGDPSLSLHVVTQLSIPFQ